MILLNSPLLFCFLGLTHLRLNNQLSICNIQIAHSNLECCPFQDRRAHQYHQGIAPEAIVFTMSYRQAFIGYSRRPAAYQRQRSVFISPFHGLMIKSREHSRTTMMQQVRTIDHTTDIHSLIFRKSTQLSRHILHTAPLHAYVANATWMCE